MSKRSLLNNSLLFWVLERKLGLAPIENQLSGGYIVNAWEGKSHIFLWGTCEPAKGSSTISPGLVNASINGNRT